MAKITKVIPKDGQQADYQKLLDFARNYTSMAERCSKQVSEKLKLRGANEIQVSEILQELSTGRYLSDERYAQAFTRDKSRHNQWGPRKISMELYRKGIEKSIIEQALKSIEADEYNAGLKRLCEKKLATLTKLPGKERKAKTIRFLLGKGFPASEVFQVVDETTRGMT